MGTIEDKILGCRDKLSSFVQKLASVSDNAVVLPWSDQLGRLQVWIEENRITSNGRCSLKRRLEGSSHIVSALLELFSTLGHIIQSCADWRPDYLLATEEIDHAPLHSENLTDMLDMLTDDLDSLYDLSSHFTNTMPIDMLTDPVFHAIDAFDEKFDVAHVEAKYPSASLPLVQRLGSMNTRRRSSLWYQQRKNDVLGSRLEKNASTTRLMASFTFSRKSHATDHSASLSSDPSLFGTRLDAHQEDTDSSRSSVSLSQEMKKKKRESHPGNARIHRLMLPKLELEQQSDGEVSGDSLNSFGATVTASSKLQARVPKPPPNFYNDQPFICMYCFKTLKNVKTHRSWKRHVMRDLKPYICSYGGCPEEASMFHRRRDWFQHELSVHRTYWECPRGCLELFFNSKNLRAHMIDKHQTQLTHFQLETLAKALAKQQDGRHKASCKLCGEEYPVNKELRRHVGGEMEEIALFVIPRPHDFCDASDGSSDTDGSDSSGSLSEDAGFSEFPSAEVEANIAPLADTATGEDGSVRSRTSRILKQKMSESGKSQLEVGKTASIDEHNEAAASDAVTKSPKRPITKDGSKTDLSDFDFHAYRKSRSIYCQHGRNNSEALKDLATADRDSPSNKPKSTTALPVHRLSQSPSTSTSFDLGNNTPTGFHPVLDAENFSQVYEDNDEWLEKHAVR